MTFETGRTDRRIRFAAIPDSELARASGDC
jgi:hypothetical protein